MEEGREEGRERRVIPSVFECYSQRKGSTLIVSVSPSSLYDKCQWERKEQIVLWNE